MADDPPRIVSWVGEQFLSGSLLPLPIVPIEGREPLIHDVQGIPRCHVRFGSLADIGEWFRDVRFTPQSGHAQRQHRCLLSAISRLLKLGTATDKPR
jgi:hypothetical protein